VYEQHDPSKVDSNSARVAHLQYNTPIGLYSKENAIEALKGQTRGKPGEGTMAITGVGGPSQAYNPSVQSDLHRLILEEESGRRGGGRQASGAGQCFTGAETRDFGLLEAGHCKNFTEEMKNMSQNVCKMSAKCLQNVSKM